MNIRLVRPYVGEEELKKLQDVINRSWLGRGPVCKQFEEKWSNYLGVKMSTSVNSGTAALHLAVLAFKFPKKSKVIVPAMTFCSTANAAIYNVLEPVFVDVNENTLSLDIDDMKKKYTKDCVAVIPVHFGGHPAEMEKIVPWAHSKGMKVISDCAHVSGGIYKGKKLGTWADISCFSFQEKKILSTGDGGMISSNFIELIEYLQAIKELGMTSDTYTRYHLETQGTSKGNPLHWYYEIHELGYKYNMSDLVASVGLAQLEKIDYINKNRIDTMAIYLDGIKNCRVAKPAFPYDLSLPYYDFMLKLKNKQMRDKFILFMQGLGISTGVHTMPVPLLPFYKKFSSNIPTAMKIWERYVVLPFYVDMSNKEQSYVIEAINMFDRKY